MLTHGGVHPGLKDFTVSPNRQIYIIDVALPNGASTSGGNFGPNTFAKYAFDAQTGNFISSMFRGKRICKSIHAR